MANAQTYQSEFTGPQMDQRFAAVAELQSAITELQTAVSAKYSKPAGGIPSTDLDADVNAALAKANSAIQSLADYYTKAEVDALIATINGQQYVDVASLPTASASTLGKIYLVGPDASGYYSYYYTSYNGSAYSWVGPLGTTQISLANYATKTELGQLDQKVDDLSTGKYYGYFATAASLPASATVAGFAYVGTGPSYVIYNFDGTNWTSSGVSVNQSPIGNGTDIDQDAEGKMQFANRVYNSQSPDGLGYVILRKDATFVSQVTDTNTIYEVRYDFDLGNSSVTIPTGCVLNFNGGKILNGTLVGQLTKISAGLDTILDVTMTGTWDVAECYPEWFGALGNGSTDDSSPIQKAINTGVSVRLCAKTYAIQTALQVIANTTIIGAGAMKTIIKAVGCNGITTDGSKVGVLLSDFKIDGDGTTNQRGISFGYNMPKLVMRNIYVGLCGDWGIWLDNSWDMALIDINVSANANGFYARRFNSSTLDKVVAYQNTGYGVVVAESANARISGSVQENGLTGLMMQGCYGCSVSVYGEQNGYSGNSNETKSQIVLSNGSFSSNTSICNDVVFYLLGGKTSEMPSSYGVYLNWASNNVLRGYSVNHVTKDYYETGNSLNNVLLAAYSQSVNNLTAKNYMLIDKLKMYSVGATSARPASPTTGMMFYDSTLGKCIVYNGSAWINVDGSSLS